jgi:hypothetical protein
MSFFDIKDSVPVKSSFLSYSFPEVTLFNQGQWSKEKISFLSSNYFYKIKYPANNDTRLSYFKNGTPSVFRPTHMYICGLIHNNITGLTSSDKTNIVGELVIECVNDSDFSKVFLCVFLQSPVSASTMNPTTVDNIINMINSDPNNQSKYITSIQSKLDVDIPASEKCIIYKDFSNFVIMLMQPIVLTTDTTNTIISKLETSTALFSMSAPNDYKNVTDENANGANIPADFGSGSGGDKKASPEDEIYIDCKPTGPGVGEVTTYQIPINSAFSQDLQQMNFIKTGVNFFIFTLAIMTIYLIVPMAYKSVVIDKVNVLLTGDKERKIRIRSVDVCLSFLFLAYGVTNIFFGFSKDGNIEIAMSGLFVLTFFLLSASIIQFNKLSDEFMRTRDITTKYIPDEEKTTSFYDHDDIFKFIGLAGGYATKVTNGPFMHILVLLFLFTLLMLYLRSSDQIKPKDFITYFTEIGLLIIIGFPIFYFFISP